MQQRMHLCTSVKGGGQEYLPEKQPSLFGRPTFDQQVFQFVAVSLDCVFGARELAFMLNQLNNEARCTLIYRWLSPSTQGFACARNRSLYMRRS